MPVFLPEGGYFARLWFDSWAAARIEDWNGPTWSRSLASLEGLDMGDGWPKDRSSLMKNALYAAEVLECTFGSIIPGICNSQ